MAFTLSKESKANLVKQFGKTEKDTGAVPVQVAILTKRIDQLAPHFEQNPKDHASKRGLMQLIGQRKSLLRYLENNDLQAYQKVIKDLGLRK